MGLASANALRMPMDNHFGMDHVMSDCNKASRLDSIKVYGEWGGWVDSSSFFHYDANSRLTAAEGYNGNSSLASKVTVEYAADGSFVLTETLLYESRNPYMVYTYNYGADKKLKSVKQFAVDRQQTSTTEVSYKKIKNGEIITCKSIDGGENSVTKKDAKGKILDVDFGTVSLTYNYDKNGNLTSMVQSTDGKKSFVTRSSYEYDKQGKAVSYTSYPHADQKDTLVSNFEYSAEGKIIRRIERSNYTDFTYNLQGNVLMETRIDNENIYGAKNKVYFYNNFKKVDAPNTAYDLTKYPIGSPVALYGKLCVKDAKLCDKNGNPVQLRGISTHGVQWFTNIYTNPDAIDAMVDNWGINVLRIAMYVQEKGYATNAVKTEDEWNTYIDSVTNLCAKKGIYCIIDWHILTPGDPMDKANYDKAMEFWNYMSKKHAKDAHVLYEICNEPNGGDVSWPRVREYGRKIIDEIRKNDKSSVVLVGTPVWSQDVDVASLAQIEDQDVMYSLHFYAGSHGKPFRQRGERALAANAPIFITEFGTSDASGDNGFFRDATLTWLKWAKKNNLSWCNWSFADKGESASLLHEGDAQKGNWNNATEAGKLIRCVLRDPSMASVNMCVDDNDSQN